MDPPALNQHSARVPGAARGIGQATLEALTAAGWRVAPDAHDQIRRFLRLDLPAAAGDST